ncbi:MAG: tRNA (5-methylaminomethyl-2-thiouridine)(34)-methyltransferase MnmD, partial [Pseudomonadota bacterium]
MPDSNDRYCTDQAAVDWLTQSLPHAHREDDVYWSASGGLDEKRYVYIEGNNLSSRFRTLGRSSFLIFELGFGFGLNFLLTAETWLRHARPGRILHYVAAERTPVAIEDLRRLFRQLPIQNADRFIQIYPAPIAGLHTIWFQPGICLHLYLGEASALLADQSLSHIDCIFLDGFSPAQNPDAWTPHLLCELGDASRAGATLSTYSVAGRVRRNLEAAGFHIRRRSGFGQKNEMLTATLVRHQTANDHLTVSPSVAVIGGGLAGRQVVRSLERRGIQPTTFDNGAASLPMYALSPQVSLSVTPESRLSLIGTQFTNNHLPVQRVGLHRHMAAQRRDRILSGLDPTIATSTPDGVLFTNGGYLYEKDVRGAEPCQEHMLINASVTGLVEQDTGVVVTFVKHGAHSKPTMMTFDHVYIAAPDQSLTPMTPVPLSLVWGQSAAITTDTNQPGPVVADGASIIPGPSGFLVSATYDRDRDARLGARYQDTETLIAHFRRSYPNLPIRKIVPMTGLRITTPVRVPIAGPAPIWAMLEAYCAEKRVALPFQHYSNR